MLRKHTKRLKRALVPLASKRVSTSGDPPENFPIEVQAQLLSLIEGGATITEACDTLWLERHIVYRAIRKDAKFAVAYDEAIRIGTARVEDELHLSCFQRRPGDIKAILAYLSSRDPARWRPTYRGELSGPNGRPIEVNVEQRNRVITEILDLMHPVVEE